jgi:hypothetical protein
VGEWTPARAVLELYGLAPGEFTAARNALVQAAEDVGEHPAGDAVRALRKPTLAAWLANQLVRTETGRVNELTGLGDRLRVGRSCRLTVHGYGN